MRLGLTTLALALTTACGGRHDLRLRARRGADSLLDGEPHGLALAALRAFDLSLSGVMPAESEDRTYTFTVKVVDSSGAVLDEQPIAVTVPGV